MSIGRSEKIHDDHLGTTLHPSGHLRLPAITVVAFSVLVVYLNAFRNGFVMDDRTLIVSNEAIRSLSNLWSILLHDYRPLRTISYALDYAVWGLNPIGYHLTNILLHVLNSLCLYGIVRRIWKSEKAAFFSSILFALHPIHTEAVSYLSGRRDVLFTFFYLLGFYFFLSYRRTSRPAAIFAVIACFLLSLLTKEMAASFPFLLFGYDLFYYNRVRREEEGSRLKRLAGQAISVLRRYLIFYLFLFSMIPAFVYYYVRLRHASSMVSAGGIAWWGGSILSNFLTVASVLAHDVLQSLFPIRMVADYFAFPVIHSALDPVFIRSILVLVLVCVLFIITLRPDQRVAFSIFWFFATLLPVMQIIPHHDLLADHFLYLPSAGVCFIMGGLVDRVMQTKKVARLAPVLLVMIMGFYAVRTWERNRDWRDNIPIYLDDLKAFPGNRRVHLLLGMRFLKAHLYDLALQEFRTAEEGERIFPEAYAYDGFLHYRSGEYKEALRLEKYALSIKKLPVAYFVTGQIYKRQREWKKAMDAFDQVSSGHFLPSALFRKFICAGYLCDRDDAMEAAQAYLEATERLVLGATPASELLRNRSSCREWLKRNKAAPEDCKERPILSDEEAQEIHDAILKFGVSSSRVERAEMLFRSGEMDKLKSLLWATVRGREGINLLRLGVLYEKLGACYLGDTIRVYRERLVLAPGDAETHRQLGMIYLETVEDLPRAYRHLARSLQISPGQPESSKLRKVTDELQSLYRKFSRETGIDFALILPDDTGQGRSP